MAVKMLTLINLNSLVDLLLHIWQENAWLQHSSQNNIQITIFVHLVNKALKEKEMLHNWKTKENKYKKCV